MSGLNISFKISAIDDFSRTMKDMESSVKKGFDTIGNIGKSIATAGAAGTAVLTGLAIAGVKTNAELERSSVAWETLLGSMEDSKSMMADIKKMASTTPFQFNDLDDGAKLMKAMGFEADSLIPNLRVLGDATAAVGGGSDVLKGVITALGQMQSKGKVSAEEMQQLAERGIPAWDLMAEHLGMTKKELMKLSSEGKVFSDDAIPAIMKGLEQNFGGAMEKQSKTFLGMWSTLKDNIKMLLADASAPLFDMLKAALPPIIENVTKLANWFNGLSESGKKLAIAAVVLPPILMLIGGGILMLIGALPTLTTMFAGIAATVGVTSGALLGIIGTIFGVVTALVAIGVGLYLAYQKVDWFRDAVNTAWAKIKQYFNVAMTFIKGIVTQVMTAVSGFIGEQLAKIKRFWSENGAQIMQAAKVVFSFISTHIKAQMQIIKGVFQVVWPIITNATKLAFNVIKGVVSSVIDFILGMIKFWSKVMTGDWKGAFQTLKETAKNIMNNIVNIFKSINLVQIGKDIINGLISGLKSMMGGVSNVVKKVSSLIPDGVKSFLDIHSPSRVMLDIGANPTIESNETTKRNARLALAIFNKSEIEAVAI